MGQHGRKAALHPLGRGRQVPCDGHAQEPHGGSEAETYLVRETEGVLFIETGFAVMMDYDREKDRIRLSPGGEYRRKSDGTLKQ